MPQGYDITISGADVASATLTTHEDPNLPADPSSVTVNGTSVPTSSVTAVGGNLTIDLAAAGAPLTAGSDFTVQFEADVGSAATSNLTSWASVAFDDGTDPTATSDSDDQTVVLSGPDLALTAVGGPVSVGRGTSSSEALLALSYANAVGPAELVLTFPTGFALGVAGVTDTIAGSTLGCTAVSSTWTCPVSAGEIASYPTLSVDIAAAATDAIGQKAVVTATLNPVGGADPNPADNTAHISVVVIGSTHLLYSLTMPQAGIHITNHGVANIPLGTAVVLTFTVRNAGPDPVPDDLIDYGAQGPVGSRFTLTDPDGHVWPATEHFESGSPGTLAAGQSFSRSLLVTGHTFGATTTIGVTTGQANFVDLQSQCDSRACNFASSVQLTVVAAPPPARTQPGRQIETSGPGPMLADTGAKSGQPLTLGLALLAAGCALTLAGRRAASRRR